MSVTTQKNCQAVRLLGSEGRIWGARILGVLTLTLLSFTAMAQEATDITLPAGVAYVTRLQEWQLPKFGCTFAVSNPSDLVQLLDLIERSEIRQSGEHANQVDPRFSVELTARDGSRTKLLFEDLLQKDRTVEGSLNGAPAEANAQFPSALRMWASNLTPATPSTHGRCV